MKKPESNPAIDPGSPGASVATHAGRATGALEAIAQADLILLGPGSLYTSLLPNLLVPELVSVLEG